MFIPRSTGQDDLGSRVLDSLKLTKSFVTKFCKHAVAKVKSRQYKSMDQALG